jgi:hypothetical protein
MSDHVFLGKVDGEIAIAWGVMRPTLLATEGYVWLIATETAKAHPAVVIRHSRAALAHLLSLYPKLVGECSLTDGRARKWLRWLGADFSRWRIGMGTMPFEIKA